KQPVIDKEACKTRAYGARDQSGGYGRIDPARQSANRMSFADLFANLCDGVFDERIHRPIATAPADREKVRQDPFALRSVSDFGMELDSIETAGMIFGCAESVLRARNYGKALRRTTHIIAVTHPDGEAIAESRKEIALRNDLDLGGAVFASVRRL